MIYGDPASVSTPLIILDQGFNCVSKTILILPAQLCCACAQNLLVAEQQLLSFYILFHLVSLGCPMLISH